MVTLLTRELYQLKAGAPATSSIPKFEVRNLDLFYGTNHVLHNIQLELAEHQVSALIGPSGCGKSTMLRTLNRMNDLIPGVVIKGQVLLNSEDIYNPCVDVVDLRKRVGMVFQRPNPFPMSVFENVAYGPRRHGLRDRYRLAEIVELSLKKAALWDEVRDHLFKSALHLSGGQQQRLCIARAIAAEPELILMDEPCSAIDPVGTAKIEELVSELKSSYTIALVTHNMQQAARVSDYTAFFFEGRIIEFGATSQIFENPAQKQTEDYITGRFG